MFKWNRCIRRRSNVSNPLLAISIPIFNVSSFHNVVCKGSARSDVSTYYICILKNCHIVLSTYDHLIIKFNIIFNTIEYVGYVNSNQLNQIKSCWCVLYFFGCCLFIQCGLFNGTCHWCRKLGTTLLALKARRMLEVKVTAFGFFFISAIKAGFCSAVNSTLSFQILSATLHTLLRVMGPSMSGQFEYVSSIHYARLKSNVRFYCHYVMYMYNSVTA